MRDRNVLEGWLAANFIAMIAYYSLFARLKNAKMLNNFSSKDIIETAKSIYKIKISGNWHLSEITAKTNDFSRNLK